MAGVAGPETATEPVQQASGLANYLSGNWHKLLILAIVLAVLVYGLVYMRRRFPIVREFFQFLRERKLWWMMPIIIVFIFLAVLIVTMESSAIAPFIYALF